jgi:hypothetical protein
MGLSGTLNKNTTYDAFALSVVHFKYRRTFTNVKYYFSRGVRGEFKEHQLPAMTFLMFLTILMLFE